ncbi:MAG: acyl-CoA synthetase [Microthrixaceae bacterium]
MTDQARAERDQGMNLATVWETVAATVPDAPALIHGDVIHGDLIRTWAEFESRSARLAGALAADGITAGSKVAVYMYNRPEYIEATFAAFKLRAATVNVNYRYLAAELRYLFDNSDSEAVVFHAEFADRLDSVRGALPKLRTFVCVGSDNAHPCPDWALDYEAAVRDSEPAPVINRSGDDLWLLYTGGTTGSPKGVMWPHRSLLGTGAATFGVIGAAVPETPDEVAAAVTTFHERNKAIRLLPAAPLMHGTSAITSVAVLSAGGAIVTLSGRSFDGHELCQAVDRNKVTQLTIVGDAFAKPILAALDEARAAGKPYDISSLKIILSSGVMWSKEAKESLLEWCSATLADSLGSSEGVGFATSVSRRDAPAKTARFALGPNAKVFTEEGHEVTPGSGERGLLAVGGPIPVGYYNDPVKSAETFREFAGRIWSVPGDYATVEPDGTIHLLGRGSACINTAGEKVYPEEVEEALKSHPAVHDANVVGVPDEKWGSAVQAVVSLEPSFTAGPDLVDELTAHCRSRIAAYKCPKRIVIVDRVERGPNGKPDYRWAGRVLGQTPDS